MAYPGLSRDAVTFYREAATADSEGNAVGTLSLLLETRGTWGSASTRELELAAQRGQQVDAVVGMDTPSTEIKAGDVADVRGERWVVTHVRVTPIHTRVFVRRAE